MRFQAQENISSHSDFTVDNHTGIRYHIDMKRTPEKIGIESGRVSVYWMNHGYYSDMTFPTLVDAVAYAREKGPSV